MTKEQGERVSWIVASWVLTAAREQQARLVKVVERSQPKASVRATSGRLVVTTECREDEMDRLHRALETLPGVQSVMLVAAYRDEESLEAP